MGVSHVPILRGRALAPTILEPPTYGQALTYSDEIWHDNTCGGRLIELGEKETLFLGRQAPPPRCKGRNPCPSPNFKTSDMVAHSTRNNNQILHGDQIRRVSKFFTRSTRNAVARSVGGSKPCLRTMYDRFNVTGYVDIDCYCVCCKYDPMCVVFPPYTCVHAVITKGNWL